MLGMGINMKRILFIFSFILIFIFIFCECEPNKSDSVASNRDGSSNTLPVVKTQLTLLFYYEGQERFSIISNLCNVFNNEQNKIEVMPEFVPFEDLKKRLITGFADGTPPDIVIFDKADQAYLADKKILVDISDQISDWTDLDQYYENSMNSCMYKGGIYGMPFGENCLGLFYNKKMFDEEKIVPPKNWEELRVTAKKLSKNNIKGIGICGQDSEQGFFQFLPWFYSAGASIEKVDSPEAINAFSLLNDLVKSGSMSREVINWSQADVMKQFANQKIAMMLNGPWQISELKLKAPNLEYGVSKIPMDIKSVTILGGENIGVIDWKNKGYAFKFLRYVCNSENVKSFSKAMGYFPSRKDISVDEVFEENQITKFFENEMKEAIPRGSDPKWPEISKIVTKALHVTLSQTKLPEAAAKDAQVSIEGILN